MMNVIQAISWVIVGAFGALAVYGLVDTEIELWRLRRAQKSQSSPDSKVER